MTVPVPMGIKTSGPQYPMYYTDKKYEPITDKLYFHGSDRTEIKVQIHSLIIALQDAEDALDG